jgi:hypothetical protein
MATHQGRQPLEVPSKWMLGPLSRGDGEMSMLAVKQQNYAASKNGFEQPEMQHTMGFHQPKI